MSSDPRDNPFYLPVEAVRRGFDRAAATFADAGVVARVAREELLARLDLVRVEPKVVLDAGCGQGAALPALRRRFPDAALVGLDVSAAMLAHAPRDLERTELLQGDVHALPLPAESVDVVFCSLALAWCHDPEQALAECRRVLAPGGLLHFATLGPDTLGELRAAWAAVDDRPHVHYFYDMHDVGDALMRAGFAEPVMDVDYLTLTYDDLPALMRDLQAAGSGNRAAGRRRGLTGRRALAAVGRAYERWRREGRLPARYEIVYGQAWASPQRPQKIQPDGTVAVPLDGLLGGRGPKR